MIGISANIQTAHLHLDIIQKFADENPDNYRAEIRSHTQQLRTLLAKMDKNTWDDYDKVKGRSL